jgi:hypothetical protein
VSLQAILTDPDLTDRYSASLDRIATRYAVRKMGVYGTDRDVKGWAGPHSSNRARLAVKPWMKF